MEEFDGMRKAGRLAADILDYIGAFVKPGVSTEYLNHLCADYTTAHGAISAPLGYKGFPKSICTSVNHVICHGIPGDKILQEGDIINIDVTPIVDGWHGDSSRMFPVGKIGVKAKKLCSVTYQALMTAIATVKPGSSTFDIGKAIQDIVSPHRYSIVRDYCGHGTGKIFHSDPQISHYPDPSVAVEIKPGMIFTIEPMINIGKPDTKLLEDKWTVVTRDKSLTAQFEHTIGVTENGVEIFTLSANGTDCPTDL